MSKCTHDSSEVIFTHNEISVEICTWGCGELLVSVTKENSITDTFTVSELSAMQARIEELEKANKTANALLERCIEPVKFCAECSEEDKSDEELLKEVFFYVHGETIE